MPPPQRALPLLPRLRRARALSSSSIAIGGGGVAGQQQRPQQHSLLLLAAHQQPQQHPLQQQQQQYQGSSSVRAFVVAAASAVEPVEASSNSSGGSDTSSSSSQLSMVLPMLPQPASSQPGPQLDCEEQQGQQQPLPPPVEWHFFDGGSSSSNSLSHQHHRHAQQLQQPMPAVPAELQQLPADTGPAVVDITHLLNLQLAADEQEEQQQSGGDSYTINNSSSTWSASRKKQWQKLSLPQKQLRVLESIHGQRQQLLWVTVHQPQGGRGPAAVWVKPWGADLDPEQLRFSEGPLGQVSVLLELGDRPELGQQPAAIVQGLQFAAWGVLPVGGSNSTSSTDGNNASSSSDGASSSSIGGVVSDWLLLSSGDFSTLEHENMFPNALVHCGDGRELHSARVSNTN